MSKKKRDDGWQEPKKTTGSGEDGPDPEERLAKDVAEVIVDAARPAVVALVRRSLRYKEVLWRKLWRSR
jgi:hypothetical protein